MAAARHLRSVVRSSWRSVYHFLFALQQPRLIHKPGSSLAALLVRYCPVISEGYRPTIWCSGAKIQTMVLAMKRALPVTYRRELLETPDGGEIALDWLDSGSETSDNPATHPTVLILPAATSTSKQNYVASLVRQVAQSGYRVLVFNNRGLGGVALKTPRTFCAANTEDLEFVVASIREAYPGIPLLAVGTCMGGVILTNYLVDFGSQGKDTGLVGALTISAPWNMDKLTESLEETLHNVLLDRCITKRLHRLLGRNRAVFEDAAHQLPALSSVDRALQTSSLYNFDNCITAPVFGFENVDAYYKAASLHTKPLDAINVPLLCLCAADDPIVPEDSIPCDVIKTSSNVVLALTAHGGHLGFKEGFFPTAASYADRLTSQYVKTIFEHGSDI